MYLEFSAYRIPSPTTLLEVFFSSLVDIHPADCISQIIVYTPFCGSTSLTILIVDQGPTSIINIIRRSDKVESHFKIRVCRYHRRARALPTTVI